MNNIALILLSVIATLVFVGMVAIGLRGRNRSGEQGFLTTHWRFILGRVPIPMLALVASYGVYKFLELVMPWYFALAGAAAFELTYTGLAVADLKTEDERKRARHISIGAVLVSILYNTSTAYFHRNPDFLLSMSVEWELILAAMHGVPLATIAYLVVDLLLHGDRPAAPVTVLATIDEQPVVVDERTKPAAMEGGIAVRMIAVTRGKPLMQRRTDRLLAAPQARGKVTVTDLRKAAATDPRAAEIIRMKDQQGMTFVQIGEHFGFSHQHASNLYRTAKRAQAIDA